jgi:hypothetical protein
MPPLELSPSSILLLPSSRCAFIPARKKKQSARVSKLFFKFFKIALILKLRNLQLRKSRKVCNPVVDMFFEQFVYESIKDAALEPAAHTTLEL